ncbi:MAG: hypothetical protein LBS84_05465, partial [Clostridiales bacterium]|nr:hypothetical protein [Clostridiales bacterium]
SAAQGKTLNDGKVDITGDTLTGTLTTRTVNIQSGYTLQHNGTTIIDTNGIVARAKYNDLAELFTRGDNDIEPGDVLAYYWATDSVHKAARCDEMIIGVCSDTYGFLLGGDENNPEKYAAVALTGRVNVKVVGKVRPGDPLVLSSVSGIAQSSLVRYYGIPIIGKALAPHDGERVDRIPMLVVMS